MDRNSSSEPVSPAARSLPTADDESVSSAHEYLRVSVDRYGRERSTNEQHDDNERARERYGWREGRTYRDTASASRYGRKRRDDFLRLLEDMRAGGVFTQGDVLRLWEPSRGSRKQAEWALFLDLCQEQGVRIYVTSHDRVYDLDNPRDRRTLDEDGTDAAYESAKVSLRIQRDVAANAAKGRPHGAAQYGYRHVYDANTGEFLRREPRDDEAVNVRELFARLAQHQSLRSIARDWEARSIRTRSGIAFTPEHLRSLALTAAYVGLRVHNPGVRKSKGRLGGPGMVYEADWPALVSPGVFYAVQEFLTDPARRSGFNSKPGRAVHFLTGIGRCDVCGGPLSVKKGKRHGRNLSETYRCFDKGCIRVVKRTLDEYVEDVILSALESEEAYTALVPRDADTDAELAKVRGELAELHARHRELASAVASGQLSALFASHSEPEILAGIKKAQAREQALSTPRVLDGLITPGADVRDRWKDAELSTRREVARLLLSPALLGELRIMRAHLDQPGGTPPIHERAVFRKAG
jgi:DNA invertase Pin-like site-specific DNA recombinase